MTSNETYNKLLSFLEKSIEEFRLNGIAEPDEIKISIRSSSYPEMPGCAEIKEEHKFLHLMGSENEEDLLYRIMEYICIQPGRDFVGMIEIILDPMNPGSNVKEIEIDFEDNHIESEYIDLSEFQPIIFDDFHNMLFGENGENPFMQVLGRCIAQARDENENLRITIRTKENGANTSRQEHSMTVETSVPQDTEEISLKVYEMLLLSPGLDFNGEVRINFQMEANQSVKYGSFTRMFGQVKQEQSEVEKLREVIDHLTSAIKVLNQ